MTKEARFLPSIRGARERLAAEAAEDAEDGIEVLAFWAWLTGALFSHVEGLASLGSLLASLTGRSLTSTGASASLGRAAMSLADALASLAR
jgi:hypothetical protein